jgi:superfamily I DNA/RNA helicase
MAKMYPSNLPNDTYSKGEKELYRLLQEQLPDAYVVIHGAKLTLSKTMQADDEGEIDFLILHRDHPLMVLEVKDQSAIDIQEGRWLARTNAGLTPPEQVKKNAGILRNMLRTERQTRDFKYATKTFVAFTNLSIPQGGWLASDLPRDRVLDLNDCRNLLDALPKMAGKTTGDYCLSRNAIQAVVNFLARDVTIKVPDLRSALEQSEQQIVEMSPIQHHILKMLGSTPRIAIPGCAGSGKTMLAMENARLLARQNRRVLLTCHTSELARAMRVRMRGAPEPELNLVTVEHFHGLARRVLGSQYSQLFNGSLNENEFYEKTLPEALFDRLPEIEERFDAIIADEGQDFHELSWDVLDGMLEQPGMDVLQVFYDDNQRVFKRDAKLTVPISLIHLNVNFRNSDSIHEWVRRYHQDPDSIHAAGIDGPVPEVIPTDDGDCKKQVQKLLDRLVNKNSIQTQNIVVLTPWSDRNPRTSFPEELRLGNFQLSRKKPPKNLGIAVRTISAFKGMESPIVILTELTHIHRDNVSADLYVGLSRARGQLYIVGDLPEPPPGSGERLFQVSSAAEPYGQPPYNSPPQRNDSHTPGFETDHSIADEEPIASNSERTKRSAVEDLIELDSSQQAIVTQAVLPSTRCLVTGGPGTGKSVVLIHAAAEIVGNLLLSGASRPRVLFTTYTRALERACRQQLYEVLGEDRRYVEIRTADSIAKQLVEEDECLPEIADRHRDLIRLVRAARARVLKDDRQNAREWALHRSIAHIEDSSILDEITSVIEGRLFDSESEYHALDPGRIALRLNARQREATWRIYREFNALLVREGRITWTQLRRKALAHTESEHWDGRYHAVIVDEAQDLELSSLRLLQKLALPNGQFLVSADPNQSIYPVRTDATRDLREGFVWWHLNTSYRSPKEVMEAASEFVRARNTALPDTSTSYSRTGRQPILRIANDESEELQYLVEYFRWIQGNSAESQLEGSCLLVPTRERGESIADALVDHHVSAFWMSSDRFDLRSRAVKVLTLHSAKGLEFRNVAIAGFCEPKPQPGVFQNRSNLQFPDWLLLRKLLYVGMTRTIRTLLLVQPSVVSSSVFEGIEPGLWNTKTTDPSGIDPIPS